MSTIRDDGFEAWRSGEHDGLVKAFTAREMSAARAAFEFADQAATERAAKQEREECLAEVEGQRLCEEILTEGDQAYERALDHVAAAIRAKGGEAK